MGSALSKMERMLQRQAVGSPTKEEFRTRLEALAARGSQAAAALAAAPVKPASDCPPLDTAGAPVIRVGSETIGVAIPDEAWATVGDCAQIGKIRSNEGNNQAALRNHLDQPFEWGLGADGREEMRIAVLLEVDGLPRLVVLEGTEGAIRRALPDKTTLALWQAAGATEFPLWNFDPAAGPVGSVCWVPIEDVSRRVRVLQMEYAARAEFFVS